MFRRMRKGQSTLEYAILIAVTIAGVVAMQVYMKKAQQGRLRSGSDDLGKQFDPAVFSTTTNITNGESHSTETQANVTSNSEMDRKSNWSSN
jgi:hypothetical protein